MDEQRKVAEEFDQYRDTYSDTVNDSLSFSGLDVDFFTIVKAEYIIELIDQYFGGEAKGLKALDVGCGVGNFHGLLMSAIAQLHGVDVSSASIEKAKEVNKGVHYEVYDGNALPYEDNSFDLVFTICVMHHVPTDQWNDFVSQMHRVLKPGGLALIFEHNPLNPLTMHVVNNCPFDADAVLLKGKNTVSLLEHASFSFVDLHYILTVPSKGMFLKKVDQLFSRLPIGAQYYVSAVKAT